MFRLETRPRCAVGAYTRNTTEQADKGGLMQGSKTLSRRTFLSTSASFVATGASLIMLPKGYAALGGALDDSQAHSSRVQGGHHTDDEMQKCIQLCQDCQALCIQTVMHCLKIGGHHAAPEHIRLLLDCAQMCETTAQYLLRGSSLHERICGLCAEVCQECAEGCERIATGDQLLKRCAELCRRCAGSCEHMGTKTKA